VLHKHGIFTWGDTAKQAYERMIEMVSLAEAELKKGRKKAFAAAKLPKKLAAIEEVAPILRGLTALGGDRRPMAFDFRGEALHLAYVNGRDVARYSQVGVVTPDHTIRTKNVPLIVPAPEAGKLDAFALAAKSAVDAFVAGYRAYFARNNAPLKQKKSELDPMPRVILVPGLGLFGLGKTAKDAAIAADIATNAIETITNAERIGRFECISEAEMFEVEYWSLEQAKLGKGQDKPFAGRVAAVTGGGGGIGAATARAFAREGAEVAVLDRDGEAAVATAKRIGGSAIGLACDVIRPAEVRTAFDAVVRRFGGVDIVVSNAGAAWQGKIGSVDDQTLRDSFELNFFAHQTVAQNAVRVMRAQGLGGALLFNVSKQAVNPGPDFGPYGLPKATTLFLSRQYALEYGADGIRVNAVNADRVNTGIFRDGLLEARAKARGLTVQQYLSEGNLLKREVKAEDVADAFVFLARAEKTTGAVLTVDGGNIAAALR
jgi:NAD(P)-dependent dehydrogenase (short-subunit alcohol dehydrogenase family)